MKSTPRGYAVVVNMSEDRDGSTVDVAKVEKLFDKLNFVVLKFIDTKAEVWPLV